MNGIQKAGLTVALACGMSFAAGSLWTADVTYGIVNFPWVDECINGPNSTFDETDSNDPCFKKEGGWWFGYVSGPEEVVGEKVEKCNGNKSGVNYVKAKINGSQVSFVGPDYESCEGPDVTVRETGESLLLDGYLEVELNIGEGVLGPPKWEPAAAALAVNFSTPDDIRDPPPIERDMAGDYGFDGFCLKYESNHTSAEDFALELGWDEVGATDTEWDTWISPINAGSGVLVQDFKWESTSTAQTAPAGSYKSGDFTQEGYAKDLRRDITFATSKMKAIKIRLKGYTPANVIFKLIELGKRGECGASSPVISKNAVANSLSLSLHNRMLSVNNIKSPAPIQILNLQGAVVRSQVYAPGAIMNLNNLSSGVYMVRIPSESYSGKIMVK